MCDPTESESGQLLTIKPCGWYLVLKSARDRLAGVVRGMEEQNARNVEALRRAEAENARLRAQLEKADALADTIKIVPGLMSDVSSVVQEVWQRYEVKSDFGLSFNPDEVAGNVEDAAKAYKEARHAKS